MTCIPPESSEKYNFSSKEMENKFSTFERYVINIKRYREIFCILNKDKNFTSQNMLQKLDRIEKYKQVHIVDWETVDFTLIARQGTIFRGTLLHVAAAVGYKRIVEALLENGANIEAKCFKGFTPLHYAVKHDQGEMMEVLINENANINAVDLKGCTPLHLAAAKGSPILAKILLLAGADVNMTDRFYNVPLHFAVNCSEIGKTAETVRTLVSFGADVNAKDELGNTVLHRAILKKDNKAVLEGLLVNYEEENDRDRFTKIVMLNKNKQTEAVVQLLLKHRAFPDIRNFQGETVLHCAIVYSSLKVIKLLARYGADVNARDPMSRAPLFCLFRRRPFCEDEISRIVSIFIKKGANIDSTYRNGPPTLHAIIRNNLTLAKTVIRFAVQENHDRDKPGYLRDYPDLSTHWDSISNAVKGELQRLSTELDHKAIFDLMRSTNLNKLSMLVNNENVLSKLNYCKVYFPAHIHKIMDQYKKGWKRFQLLNMGEKSITKLHQFSANSYRLLPREIAREIAYYLTNKEIRHLHSAVQNTEFEKHGK